MANNITRDLEIKALGGEDQYKRLIARYEQMDSDTLARIYIGRTDDLLTQMLWDVFSKSVYPDPKEREKYYTTTAAVLRLDDKWTMNVPLTTAPMVLGGVLRIVSNILQERDAPPDVSGEYDAIAQGSCPFESGKMEIAQRGFVIEGTRSGHLLLIGALSRSKGFFLTTDKKYLILSKPEEHIYKIDFFDPVSEIYSSELNAPFSLVGTKFGICTVTLTHLS
jgi:hypothetical protein